MKYQNIFKKKQNTLVRYIAEINKRNIERRKIEKSIYSRVCAKFKTLEIILMMNTNFNFKMHQKFLFIIIIIIIIIIVFF